MIEMIFTLLMIWVFIRLISLAIRFSWGLMKVLVTIVFFPALITGAFVAGLLQLACPLLMIIGIYALFQPLFLQ